MFVAITTRTAQIVALQKRQYVDTGIRSICTCVCVCLCTYIRTCTFIRSCFYICMHIFIYLQIVYLVLLVIFSQMEDGQQCNKRHAYIPDNLVAYFCIGHAVLWVCITILDRIIQWRHQIIRKRGYLTFYRKMRNLRRVPFVIVSTGEQ